MRNKAQNKQSNRFRIFFTRLKNLVSYKRRNERALQVETMKIMNRIMDISRKHPELLKYLNEMPEFPPVLNDSKIEQADLRKYNNNLLELLKKYEHRS